MSSLPRGCSSLPLPPWRGGFTRSQSTQKRCSSVFNGRAKPKRSDIMLKMKTKAQLLTVFLSRSLQERSFCSVPWVAAGVCVLVPGKSVLSSFWRNLLSSTLEFLRFPLLLPAYLPKDSFWLRGPRPMTSALSLWAVSASWRATQREGVELARVFPPP